MTDSSLGELKRCYQSAATRVPRGEPPRITLRRNAVRGLGAGEVTSYCRRTGTFECCIDKGGRAAFPAGHAYGNSETCLLRGGEWVR